MITWINSNSDSDLLIALDFQSQIDPITGGRTSGTFAETHLETKNRP